MILNRSMSKSKNIRQKSSLPARACLYTSIIFTGQYRLHLSSYIFICDCPARDPVGLDSDLQNLGILSPTIVPAWLAKVSSKWSWTYTSGKFSWRHTWWQSNASSISNSSHCYLIANMLLIHLAPAVRATFAKFWIFESVRNVRKQLDRADLEVSFTALTFRQYRAVHRNTVPCHKCSG